METESRTIIGRAAARLFIVALLLDFCDAFQSLHSSTRAIPHQRPISRLKTYQDEHHISRLPTSLRMSEEIDDVDPQRSIELYKKLATSENKFDLSTALFCGGLAFDAYVEPPPNSARWEKGSQGLKVAFVSNAYTRQLYKGIVEVVVQKVTNLPDGDDNAVEKLVTGDGVDACVFTAAVEGSWKEDVRILEKEQFHEGVFDLSGAAHVVSTSTAWANIDEAKSKAAKNRRGWAAPYHVKGSWGKKPQAIWPEENPLYIYVQDPSTVRLVFTVLDADRVGRGTPIGSTHTQLQKLIPQAALNKEQLIESLKEEMMEAVKRGEIDLLDENTKIQLGAKTWQGELKLNSKPRKKDKNSQIMAGAAAGAYVAGPVGALAGAAVASFYEGQIQGSIHMRMRYLPIPDLKSERDVYDVKGGLPGVDWGELFSQHSTKAQLRTQEHILSGEDVDDLEHCFFVNHDSTGATCAVYRSLKRKLIVVSFRGTCTPVDLVTDASLVQETWKDGDDVENQDLPKVHAGFRGSLSSVSRRLKELILATPAPGDSFEDYDMLVTGHSLGGALATLFTADIGEYGVDAGRGLPQVAESEPWWKSIASTFGGRAAEEAPKEPPRPKTLRLYSFGSPRVGNHAFADHFDSLLADGRIDCGYRIVNGDDVVARMPRTMNGLVLGQVQYDHCGPTVLITQPSQPKAEDDEAPAQEISQVAGPEPRLWIEGQSDDSLCPVRDGKALSSPMAEGSLLSDIISSTKDSFSEEAGASITDKLSSAFGGVAARLQKATASEFVGAFGIDSDFSEREAKMIKALFQGKALAHHMEDQYYAGMGRAGGFLARVDEELIELEDSSFS